MKVEYLEKFSRDLDKIRDKNLKNSLKTVIEQAEAASSLAQIRNLKKLSGFKNAYRIRIGDYRAGIFFENGVIEFARIAHRKDIYRIFP